MVLENKPSVKTLHPDWWKPKSKSKPYFIHCSHFWLQGKWSWNNAFPKKMQKLPLIVIKIIVPKIAWGDKHHLTHLRPMFHFYTPWKLQKTSGFLTFSGRYRNRELVWNRLKLIRKPNRPPLHFLKGKYLVLNFLSSQWESGIIKYGLTKQEFVIPNI